MESAPRAFFLGFLKPKNLTMQRQFIFLATDDSVFENTALDAILETYHGMRRASDIQAACRILAMGTTDIALAIIDLDLPDSGTSLLHILGGCEPDFPILVVTAHRQKLGQDETVSEISVKTLVKPVAKDDLRKQITNLCRQAEMSHEENLRHSYRNRPSPHPDQKFAGLPA